jgi:hypothetical protein
LESLASYWRGIKSNQLAAVTRLFFKNILFTLVIAIAFLPTLIAKRIIYGSALDFGYGGLWNFASPALLKVCLSSEHGLFSWTPILALAVIGLFFLRRRDKFLSLYSIAAFAAYLYTIGCYLDWAGVSSFGNRFFVSLTPLFILGLAAFFEWMSLTLRERPANIMATSITAFLIVWNLGLIFQWGTHLIPARGPISWRTAAYNQVAVVPEKVSRTLEAYLTGRGRLMNHIEQQDLQQLRQQDKNPPNPPPGKGNE